MRLHVEGVDRITSLVQLTSLVGGRERAADEEFAAAYPELFRSAMRLAHRYA